MALRCNGATLTRLQLEDGAAVPNGNDMAVCGWARMDATGSANRAVWVAWSGSPTFQYNGVQSRSNSTMMTAWFGGAQTDIQSVTLGEWFWWAFRASGSSARAWIWTNSGGMVTISGTNLMPAAKPTPNNSALFVVGDTGFSEPWNGDISAFRLFTGDITDSEIEGERFKFLPGAHGKTRGFWPFVHSVKDDLKKDYSGNGLVFAEIGTALAASIDGPPVPWGGSPIIYSQPSVAAPLLSLAGVVDVGSRTARPQVTISF